MYCTTLGYIAGGGRGREYIFFGRKKVWSFVISSMEIPDKTKLHPWKFCKIVLHPLEISGPKTKHPCKFHMNFSWSYPRNSASFLINPWNNHIVFLQYPSGNSMSSPPCLDFFWNNSPFAWPTISPQNFLTSVSVVGETILFGRLFFLYFFYIFSF